MYTRVVRGYDKLDFPQYEKGFPMFTVCPCCGFESGFDDDAILETLTIEEFRIRWVKVGSPWFSTSNKKPNNFNLREQLKRINAKLEEIQ